MKGWLTWRGPQQNGTSLETGLPSAWTLGGANDLWKIDLGGAGTPVIANGRVYALGYRGQGGDLQEVLLCADAETGKVLWEHSYSDFISDIVYDRYAIGSPCVDPETGNVYALMASGVFACYTADGKRLWERSLMEEIGRLTFTNGRNGGPMVEDDLVIVRGITSNWGADGPAMDRLYAYDRKSGHLVWSSSPGTAPKDNSFALPALAWRNGKRLMYTGTGDGSLVCINVRTGEPVWRLPISAGGMNASVLLYKNTAVAVHADENLDSSDAGRQTAINVDGTVKPNPEGGVPLLDRSAEVWRNDLAAVSSSPVLVGNRIYQVNKTGSLCCVDADTGKILWRHKLGSEMLHASPLYADGKLYIPIRSGEFFIVKPGATGAEDLAKVKLDGDCLGAPSVYNGKVYVFSTKGLYCFGKKGPGKPPAPVVEKRPAAGKAVALQVIPSEVRLRPGEKVAVTVRGIDANGIPTGTVPASSLKWAKYIPATARVKAEMNGEFNAQGELVAGAVATSSAGAFQATSADGLTGVMRGRVMPAPPFKEDFEAFNLNQDHAIETGTKFAYPPLTWIGARFKWEVRDQGGNKVFAKTLDNVFFQRATVFMTHPDVSNYTVEADLMADGNRRTQPTVGLVNQHYLITLGGNNQELEVTSNFDRLRVAVPFKWTPGTWYRMKTRVDVAANGSGVVRARVWKKGETEPAAWTIEAPHAKAHTYGSPGLFGFSPQSLFRCYVDNISVTPNK